MTAGLHPAHVQDLCSLLSGSVIVAQDSRNTVLGRITNSFDSDSIWNEFSTFGNEFNSDSPFSEFSSSPLMITKGGEVVCYLSINMGIRNSISPNLLTTHCEDSL